MMTEVLKCPRCCSSVLEVFSNPQDRKLFCKGCDLYQTMEGVWTESPHRVWSGPAPDQFYPTIPWDPIKIHDCPNKDLSGLEGSQGLPVYDSDYEMWVIGVRSEYIVTIWYCPYCGEKLP